MEIKMPGRFAAGHLKVYPILIQVCVHPRSRRWSKISSRWKFNTLLEFSKSNDCFCSKYGNLMTERSLSGLRYWKIVCIEIMLETRILSHHYFLLIDAFLEEISREKRHENNQTDDKNR